MPSVRRKGISNPGGGDRQLGIPTVVDRVIQQAINSYLRPGFSEHSYGFRRGRNTKDAVKQIRAYIQNGYRRVADIDLASVNHDKLMNLVARKVTDKRVLQAHPGLSEIRSHCERSGSGN